MPVIERAAAALLLILVAAPGLVAADGRFALSPNGVTTPSDAVLSQGSGSVRAGQNLQKYLQQNNPAAQQRAVTQQQLLAPILNQRNKAGLPPCAGESRSASGIVCQ